MGCLGQICTAVQGFLKKSITRAPFSLADYWGHYYQAFEIGIRRPAGPLQIIEVNIVVGFALTREGDLDSFRFPAFPQRL